MLVQHFLEMSARRLPDKTALIYDQERLSYRQIDTRANKLAHLLRYYGVERQDRVAIYLENSVETVLAVFGTLKADAVFLVLSPSMKGHKLSYILNDCGVKTLITHTNKSKIVVDALLSAKSVEHVLWVGEADQIPTAPGGRVSFHSFDEISSNDSYASSTPVGANIDLDLAAIIYTSGSTGDPKGIMLTHLNMTSAADSIISYLENREDDVIINALPLSFDYGLYQVLMAFKFGGTVVLERSLTYPFKVIEKVVAERVTGFPGVPTIFAILLGLKGLDGFDFSRLRYITNTAAALPPKHISQLRKIFPHVRIYSMYGLSECKRVSYLPPEEIDRRPTSVGKGMPNEEIWVVNEKGNRVAPGEPGELVVRGSNVMRGYWGLPDETARVLRPGRYPGELVLYTGDLFKVDEEGYLYFVGRKDDMIKSRGERISPKEIEDCLCALDGVAEAAVIGVPDEILGQAIVAYLRCRDGTELGAKEVLIHCRTHLEDFMLPKSVEFISSFPKTSSGKLDKLSLQAKWSGSKE